MSIVDPAALTALGASLVALLTLLYNARKDKRSAEDAREDTIWGRMERQLSESEARAMTLRADLTAAQARQRHTEQENGDLQRAVGRLERENGDLRQAVDRLEQVMTNLNTRLSIAEQQREAQQ